MSFEHTLPLAVVTIAAFALVGCTEIATDSIPTVPDVQRVSGTQIPALVQGGPYDVRIFDGNDAGTVARLTWDFGTGTVSGSFTTAGGDQGTFSSPMAVVGDQLCVGEDMDRQCHFIYAYEGGFMEVTETGDVHAVSVPL